MLLLQYSLVEVNSLHIHSMSSSLLPVHMIRNIARRAIALTSSRDICMLQSSYKQNYLIVFNTNAWQLSHMLCYSSSSSSGIPMRASDIDIPMDRIEFAYARSSGPGGQNVNKLNTKAEVRFHVDSADWLPVEVRQRLTQYQANKVSKDGYIIVTSQENRTQGKNKEDCLDKLRQMIAEAYVEPKDRHLWVGIGEKGKAKRREEKRFTGAKKENRRISRSSGSDDD